MSQPSITSRLRVALVAALGLLGVPVEAASPSLALSVRPAALRLSNAIREARSVVTVDEIRSVGLHDLATRTPWSTKVAVYRGVPLAELLRATGNEAPTVVAQLADGSSKGFPLREAAAAGAFLALERDGAPFEDQTGARFGLIFPWPEGDSRLQALVVHMSARDLVGLGLE